MGDDNPESAWSEAYCLRPYNPFKFQGSRNPNFTAADGRLLDLKDGKSHGVTAAAEDLRVFLTGLDLTKYAVLVVVPGHSAQASNEGTPLARVAYAIEKLMRDLFFVSVNSIVRTVDVEQKAKGGDRSIELNLKTTKVTNPDCLKGRTVIILDDTVTTGNSLAAARQLIQKAGAAKIATVGIARTVKYL